MKFFKISTFLLTIVLWAREFSQAKRSTTSKATGVKFWLYTKSNSKLGEETELDPTKSKSFSDSDFMKNQLVKIVSPGFEVSYKGEMAQGIKDAYLSTPDQYNIIIVDWVEAGTKNYDTASKNIQTVGAYVATLIKTLVSLKYSRLGDFHHIGHSLGSQIGAFISRNLDKGSKLARVTGLDPWVNNFGISMNPPEERLDSSDATFVDVIVTKCHHGCNTTDPDQTGGTVSFFPNGGKVQAGCDSEPDDCSHSRAYLYYIESITTKTGFKAYSCSSYTQFKKQPRKCKTPEQMGAFVSVHAVGRYYLDTNPDSPFAKG